MKLQGVEIIRINDFRKFFKIEEFCMKRSEFSNLFSRIDINCFCDTEEEKALCGQIRAWGMGQSPRASLSDKGELVIPHHDLLPLGSLYEVIKQYGKEMKTSERIAATCICLLLGAYCAADDARYIFEVMSGRHAGNFVSVCQNMNLKQDFPITEDDYSRVIYANLIPDTEYTVTCGSQTETLQSGECLVAICTSKGCVALLPRTAHSSELDAELMINISSHQPFLKVADLKHKCVIENVVSFWIESETDLLYTTMDNKLRKVGDAEGDNADFSRYFKFDRTYELFCKIHPNKGILAVKKDNNNNYKIYPNS